MKIRTVALIFLLFMLPVALYVTFGTKHLAPVHQPKTVLKKPLPKVEPPKKTLDIATIKPINLPIAQWTSDNGTPIYFVATPGIPIVDISVTFNAGTARDGAKPGLATLCANLLATGLNDGTTVEDILAQLEDTGAQYNVQVDRDKTTLSLRSLSDPNRLNPTVALFANIITNPGFPETETTTLKNQVQVELQQNLQQPAFIAKRAFYEALYGNHPYAHSATGNADSIASIDKSQLAEFHKQFFVAQNATITIVGGISEADAKFLTNQITQKVASGKKADPLPNVTALTTFTEENISFPSEQTHILMGQPCAIQNDPDYFALLLGNDILGGNGLQSRLFQDIRDKHGLVYSVRSILLQLQKPAPFVLSLQTKNAQSQQAIALLKENLNRFITAGPTDEEVIDAKSGFIRSLPLEISDNEKITYFVSNLAFYQKPLDFLKTYVKNIDTVTTTQVKETFQKRIHPETMVLVTVGEIPKANPN